MPRAGTQRERFTYTDLGSCALWLRAETEPYKDGDGVNPWRDYSGAGNHLAQATAGRQLTFKTGIINGYPAMLGDATDNDAFTTGGVLTASSTQFTLFVVIRTPSSFGTQALCQIGGSGGGSGKVLRTTGGGALEALKANVASMGTSSGTMAVSSNYVVCLDYLNPAGTFYINGVSAGTFSSAQTFSNPASGIYIGAQDDAGVTAFGGHIAELVYFDLSIGGAVRPVNQRLCAKYAVGMAA